MQEKTCKSCGVTKSVSEFYKGYVTKKGKQSYSSICKECQKKVSAKSNTKRLQDPTKRADNAQWHREWRKKTGKLTGRKGWNGKEPVVVDGKRPCRKCGEVKPIEEFYTHKGKPYYICIPCERAATNERLAHRWREQHQPKTSICPVCFTEFVHTRKKKFCSPECRKISIKISLRKPPRQKKNTCSRCGALERNRQGMCSKCYAEHNSNKYQNNKPYSREAVRKRTLRRKNVGGSHTVAEWKALKAQYDHKCLCCGKAEPEVELTRDHVIAITKGGTDDIENIQPLCRACNAQKQTSQIDFRK